MLSKLKNWLTGKSAGQDVPPHVTAAETPARPVGKKVARQTPKAVEVDEHLPGEIESLGPGKNVLVRRRFVREDSGTHETLKIIDDSLTDVVEDDGIDPYNTGCFDRSDNWGKRSGK